MAEFDIERLKTEVGTGISVRLHKLIQKLFGEDFKPTREQDNAIDAAVFECDECSWTFPDEEQSMMDSSVCGECYEDIYENDDDVGDE